MRKRFLLKIFMITLLFSTVCSAKTLTTKQDNPGTAIFVMAIPQTVIVEKQVSEKKTATTTSTIQLPQIKGLEDKHAQKKINAALKQRTEKLEKAMHETTKCRRTSYPNEVISTCKATKQSPHYLCLTFSDYCYTGKGSGSMYQDAMTIDTHQAKILTLKDLFEEGSDYEAQIEACILRQIDDRTAKDNLVLDDLRYLFKVQENQPFYLTKDGDLAIVVNLETWLSDTSGAITFTLDKACLKGYKVQS